MQLNQNLIIFILGLFILTSAIGVVYAKHESRKAFVQLQALQSKRDAMEVYWGKLQLEQGAWTTHGRVEALAESRLNMISPTDIKIVVVQP